MKKFIVLSIFLFIFFHLSDNAISGEEKSHIKYARYDSSKKLKDKNQRKKIKLIHYHGDYVKYSSSKSCCRIRD